MLCVGQKGQLQPLFSGQVPRTTLIKAETADFTGLKAPLIRCMCVQLGRKSGYGRKSGGSVCVNRTACLQLVIEILVYKRANRTGAPQHLLSYIITKTSGMIVRASGRLLNS